ncbi:hypothetical protein R5W23_000103 [Gemmata sp. JC673]|uniref:DUF1772 domain-containing protein n=1 Tax=Gemmata algarum TaxID=2975278 RepID=A0ABU5EV22_9BACT|nr:hypothetical protein [Gemmata algarum]MDY3557576.1 hypothetical protein [Gemmata algarum]
MHDEMARGVALLHLVATLFMVGVIWFVQVVHYPLLARVGRADFEEYEQAHVRLTGWVVAPPMLTELVTAVLLLWVRPDRVPLWAIGAGLALVVVNWVSTWAFQIPCHDRLTRGFEPAVHRRLVATNWLRTTVWSLRGLLVLGTAFRLT